MHINNDNDLLYLLAIVLLVGVFVTGVYFLVRSSKKSHFENVANNDGNIIQYNSC